MEREEIQKEMEEKAIMKREEILVIEYYDLLTVAGRSAWRDGTVEEFSDEFWAELDRIDAGFSALCLS